MEITEEMAKVVASDIWPNGDNFYAQITSKGKWRLSFTNDYPMQHGDGKEIYLPHEIVEMLYKAHLLLSGVGGKNRQAEMLNELTTIGNFYFDKKDYTSSTQISLAKDVVSDYYFNYFVKSK